MHVKVVVTNAQWDQALSENTQCVLLGAVVDGRLRIMLLSRSRMPGSILSTGFGGPLPWKSLPCLRRVPLGSWLMQPLVL